MLLNELMPHHGGNNHLIITWPKPIAGDFINDPEVNRLLKKFPVRAVLMAKGDGHLGPQVKLSGNYASLKALVVDNLKISPTVFAARIK